MNNKVYKITDKQLNVIVESQKNSPQLQTELFDRSGDILGKMLSNMFKNSVKLFKYLSGIKVEIHKNDSGKGVPIKYKKKNPLAPLGLGESKLSTPKISGILPDESGFDDGVFSDGFLVFPVKFKFLNLAESQENQNLQYATWNIEVKVTVNGDTLELELERFISGAPRRVQVSRTRGGNQQTQSDREYLEDVPMDYSALSVIFIGDNQAKKFMDVIQKTVIEDILTPFVTRYNRNVGQDGRIEIPKVRVKVNPEFITTEISKQTNLSDNEIQDIKDAMNALKQQRDRYQNIPGSEEYISQLRQTYIELQKRLPK